MDEEWKFYKDSGYHKYDVSNLGNAKRDGKLLNLEPKSNAYIRLYDDKLHRIVAKLFVPNPNNYNEVDHIDGNKLNNRADNLRWVTHKENMSNPITVNNPNRKWYRPEKPTKNHIWIHLGVKTKLVHKDYLDYWLDDGWLYGRCKNHNK